ncbi:hypothetical protein ACCC92_03195 [Mucilaginibacter sp. Mucisp84]|uniref:hypothetical protein n=1 Tax=Mucilaginibacter sp. Mucisp84 TaxID=3243058 RepID=UPI0039A4C232
MEAIFKSLPDILKYGVIGLVAIFAVLLFYLFKQAPTKARFLYILLPFAVITITLVCVASYAGYVSKKQDNDKTIDSLKEELRIYQGSSAANEGLQKKYQAVLSNRDSLLLQIGHVQHQIKDKETLLKNSVMLLIVEAFEDATNETSGKSDPGISKPELDFLRYKNAIFQKIYDFGADTGVLRAALTVLKKRGAEIDVNRLVKVTPHLIQLKRKWLKDAILAYENAEKALGVKQESVRFNIQLPAEVAILPNKPYTVTLTSDSYPRLEFEKELLNKVDM